MGGWSCLETLSRGTTTSPRHQATATTPEPTGCTRAARPHGMPAGGSESHACWLSSSKSRSLRSTRPRLDTKQRNRHPRIRGKSPATTTHSQRNGVPHCPPSELKSSGCTRHTEVRVGFPVGHPTEESRTTTMPVRQHCAASSAPRPAQPSPAGT